MRTRIITLLLAAFSGAVCQQRSESPAPERVASDSLSGDAANPTPRSKDILAVNDLIVVSAKDVEGIGEKPFRIELDGSVTLPLVGKIRAAGLTIDQFEKELSGQLSTFLRSPQVSVRRLSARADTILVAGAFKNPGIYALPERRTLLDVVSAVGGLQPNAGRTIKITRRLERGRIPWAAAVEDPETKVSVATVNLSRLLENPSAQEEVIIEPQDVLSASPATVVFLTGEVLKAGPFELAGRDSIGMTELISLAGGFGREAAPEKVKILRPILNGAKRSEVPVDMKRILEGRASDFPVLANDIVVVPRAKGKARVLKAAVLYVVPALATSLIYVALR